MHIKKQDAVQLLRKMEKHDRFEDDVINYQQKFQTAKKKSHNKKLKFFFDPYLSIKKKD